MMMMIMMFMIYYESLFVPLRPPHVSSIGIEVHSAFVCQR